VDLRCRISHRHSCE